MRTPPGHTLTDRLRDSGHHLQIECNDDESVTMWATSIATGERFIATRPGNGYQTGRALAELIGIDISDLPEELPPDENSI